MAEPGTQQSAAGTSATIKYGKDYDATWAVFHGTPAEIKEQAIAYFGLEGDDLAEKTPHEVILQGQDIAQATGAVTSKLGGSPWRQSGERKWPSKDDRPAAKKKAEPEKDDDHPFGQVLAQIEVAKTEDELKAIFASNREAFSNEDVKAASKKRFAELRDAA